MIDAKAEAKAVRDKAWVDAKDVRDKAWAEVKGEWRSVYNNAIAEAETIDDALAIYEKNKDK